MDERARKPHVFMLIEFGSNGMFLRILKNDFLMPRHLEIFLMILGALDLVCFVGIVVFALLLKWLLPKDEMFNTQKYR